MKPVPEPLMNAVLAADHFLKLDFSLRWQGLGAYQTLISRGSFVQKNFLGGGGPTRPCLIITRSYESQSNDCFLNDKQ